MKIHKILFIIGFIFFLISMIIITTIAVASVGILMLPICLCLELLIGDLLIKAFDNL